MKDYYQVLGLLQDVDEVVIKAAYKALAQKYHPDKHPGEKAEYNKIMSELNEAYAVIGFKHKRKDYDLKWSKSRAKGKNSKPKREDNSDDQNPHHSYDKEHKHAAHSEQDHSSEDGFRSKNDHEHKHQSHHKADTSEFDSILKKLHENQMDEYQLINLFEKTFSLKVEISSGYINNYCYTKDDKMHVVNFEKIKLELINHLSK